jgi:hypothetical protein
MFHYARDVDARLGMTFHGPSVQRSIQGRGNSEVSLAWKAGLICPAYKEGIGENADLFAWKI